MLGSDENHVPSVGQGCDTASPPSTLAGAMALPPVPLALVLQPLVASDVAFAVVFGVFLVALLTLIVIVVRWAIRRDRQGRAAWRERQAGGTAAADGDTPPPPGR